MGDNEIISILKEAGATMLALPGRGYSTGLRLSKLDVVHTAHEAYGWLRPPAPDGRAVTRMDEAFA